MSADTALQRRNRLLRRLALVADEGKPYPVRVSIAVLCVKNLLKTY